MADIAQPVTAVKTAPKTIGLVVAASIAQPVKVMRYVPIGYAWKPPAS